MSTSRSQLKHVQHHDDKSMIYLRNGTIVAYITKERKDVWNVAQGTIRSFILTNWVKWYGAIDLYQIHISISSHCE